MRKLPGYAALLLGAALLSACGGGGSAAPAPSTVAVKLATVAKSGQNPQLKGVSVTILLPAGVTLRSAGSTRQTAEGVVSYSGGNGFSNVTSQLVPRPLFGSYSAGGPGRDALTVSFIGTAPFGAGEFATVVCDVAAGASPTAAGFQVTDFHAVGDSADLFADDLTAQFEAPTVTLPR